MDDVISVSIQNSHTDPAGINFDHMMNNINSAESDAMGATLTNYLCNIINRRNAVTMTRMDFNEPNMQNCAPYASSCADNNSEISVSVRHFSVESRRNSVDSQVSQTVKMSETNIKATLEKQHKGEYNMKTKKRQRKYLYARRTNRRASSSSVESQRITNQMQSIKYKNPNSRIHLSTNSMGRQIESHRSAITTTTADIADIHQLFHRNDGGVHMQHTSDDDQSMDESHLMYAQKDEPSNMLVPLGDHQHQMGDSADSLDVSNEKQAAIEQMLKNILKNSTEKQIEALLNSCDRNGLNGRNSKIQRHSHNKMYPPNIETDFTSKDADIASSISSSIDVDCIRRLDGTQSSFSDQSANRMKTQSQNSKGSCDVGIQANDYDIVSHARQQQSRGDCTKNLPFDDSKDEKEKFQLNYHQDDETHQLLPYRKRDDPTIVRKDTLSGKHLSESEKMEKLKKLLLPSN